MKASDLQERLGSKRNLDSFSFVTIEVARDTLGNPTCDLVRI
jgi:hypothetical protein